MGDDNWLRQFGFNPLRLPRRDLRPGDLMLKHGDTFDTKVGEVAMLIANSAALPETSSGEPTADLSQQVKRSLDISFGLKLLGSLIGAATADKLGIDTSYKHARTVDVTYEDVKQDSMPVIALQSWLENGEVEGPKAAQVWLNDDELACVTAVLRSKKLSVVAKSESGEKLDLSIPEISGIVSGEVKVEASSEDSTKITFTGTDPIVFGFQAFQLIYEGNVSFGIRQVRTFAEGEPEDYSDEAWTADEEIEAIQEEAVPAS